MGERRDSEHVVLVCSLIHFYHLMQHMNANRVKGIYCDITCFCSILLGALTLNSGGGRINLHLQSLGASNGVFALPSSSAATTASPGIGRHSQAVAAKARRRACLKLYSGRRSSGAGLGQQYPGAFLG